MSGRRTPLKHGWLLLLVSLLAAHAPALGVTSTRLKATARSGQVFLSWTEAPGATQYHVYRDTAPLTKTTLSPKHRVATVPQGSSRHMGLETIVKPDRRGRRLLSTTEPLFKVERYVVEPLAEDAVGNAKPLGADEGFVCLTTREAGTYHYAVTAVAGGAEDRTVGEANTAGPVAEKVATPTPLLIWQAAGKCARIYLQYRDLADWNDSMSNVYAFPYWIAVRKNHKPGPRAKALRVYLGGYSGRINGGNFARYCDVTIRTHEAGCWWWGFSATYQYDRRKYHHGSSSPRPTTGPMKNYVQARYIDFVRWVIAQPYYSVDPEAVHTFGGSMGGVGSLLMLMDYPDVFAYGRAMVPPTNMLETKWQWLRNCEAKWGAGDDDGIKVDFHGPDAERLRAKYPDMTVHAFLNLEKRMALLEGDELPFIWAGSCGRDGSVNWPQQGRKFYTALNATRRAWAGGLIGHGGHFSMGGDGGGLKFPRQLGTIRRNQSFPAFSNVSGNPKLPLPEKPERGYFHFNSQFIWSSPTYKVAGVQEQIDTAGRYEIVIASTAGDQTADVTCRRLQGFKPVPGRKYLLQNTEVNDPKKVLQSQTVTADRLGLVTFRQFQVKSGDRNRGGSRLIITPAR
jgi:hypothetical protein